MNPRSGEDLRYWCSVVWLYVTQATPYRRQSRWETAKSLARFYRRQRTGLSYVTPMVYKALRGALTAEDVLFLWRYKNESR